MNLNEEVALISFITRRIEYYELEEIIWLGDGNKSLTLEYKNNRKVIICFSEAEGYEINVISLDGREVLIERSKDDIHLNTMADVLWIINDLGSKELECISGPDGDDVYILPVSW